MGNFVEVVKGSPLKSVVAINIGDRNGGTVLFDEFPQFVEVAVSRSSEDVEYGRLLVGFVGSGVRR